jgi:hypothetical protein
MDGNSETANATYCKKKNTTNKASSLANVTWQHEVAPAPRPGTSDEEDLESDKQHQYYKKYSSITVTPHLVNKSLSLAGKLKITAQSQQVMKAESGFTVYFQYKL